MKDLNALLKDWRQATAGMQKLQARVPTIIGVESVRVIKQNFKVQGYDSGAGVTRWPQRSPKTDKAYNRRGNYKGSVYNASNPLLMQTRNLYNSVKSYVHGQSVDVGVNLTIIPYAERMNEGGGGVPPRQFIPANGQPPNRKILAAADKKIMDERDKVLQTFKT